MKKEIEAVTYKDKEGVYLSARIIAYDLNGVYCNTIWDITDIDGKVLDSGNCIIDNNVVSEWNDDDSIILDNIAKQINVIII